MQNKKLLAVAALTGMTLGGLGLTSVASAESDRGDVTESVEETNTVDAGSDDGAIVQVQTEDDDAEGDVEGDADTEGETEGDADGNRRGHGGCNLEAAAEAIGIDEAALREARQNGSTIAEIAEENGVDVDDVIAAMVEAKTERIEAKVADGSITQERADEKLAELEDKITDRVNGVSDRDADDDADESA